MALALAVFAIIAIPVHRWATGALDPMIIATQGGILCVMLWVQYIASRGEQLLLAAIVLLVAQSANYLGFMVLSGGISGPIALLGPLLPLLASLMIGQRTAWGLAAALFAVVVAVSGMPSGDGAIPLLTLATLFAATTWVGGYYAKSNQALEREVWHQSRHDPLTGIYNRWYIEETLQTEVLRARRNHSSLCVLMVDIDHFRQLNVRLGHRAGNKCLQKIAGIIAETIRRPADIVGRFGGEEFLVLLPETQFEGGIKLAQDIRERIRREVDYVFKDERVPVTVTIGATVTDPRGGNSSDVLIARANAYLHQGKAAGRNRVEHDPASPQPVPEEDPAAPEPELVARA